jgi:hypothetical protein
MESGCFASSTYFQLLDMRIHIPYTLHLTPYSLFLIPYSFYSYSTLHLIQQISYLHDGQI